MPTPRALIPLELRVFSLGFLMLTLGCGLDRYEAKIQEQQRRLGYLREEGNNIQVEKLRLAPLKDGDKDKELVREDEFFFRPPKGIKLAAEPKRAVGNVQLFLPDTKDNQIQEVWVSARRTENKNTFQQEMLKALKLTATERKPRTHGVPGGEVRYEWIHEPSANKKTITDVYFTGNEGIQAGVAFVTAVPTPGAGGAPEGPIGYSLGSVRLGSEALRARAWVPPVGKSKKAEGKR